MRQAGRVGRTALFATAFVLLAAAASTALSVRRFLAVAQTGPGVVTRLLAGGSHPEIAFTTADGRTVTYAQGGLIAGYAPGMAVTVRYRAADPAVSACLDTPLALWTWPLMLGAVGAGLLAVALLVPR